MVAASGFVVGVGVDAGLAVGDVVGEFDGAAEVDGEAELGWADGEAVAESPGEPLGVFAEHDAMRTTERVTARAPRTGRPDVFMPLPTPS
jgi:hypothetical protein